MKRRFINDDQLPFPEGRAAGVVLDALYTGDAAAGMFRAKLLACHRRVHAACTSSSSSDGWMRLLQFKILRMDKWAGHERSRGTGRSGSTTTTTTWPRRLNLWIPKILGTDIRQLGLRLTLDAAMLGVGGLMGIRVATSVLLGALVNFAVLAPIMIQRGDIRAYTAPDGALVADLPRRDREPVVALVGRDDDGGGLAGRPVRQARDLHQGVHDAHDEEGARDGGRRSAAPHRSSALDLVRRRPDPQHPRRLGHARVLRRALVSRAHLAAADLRAHGHLRQLDGADVVDADGRAVEDHAVHHGRDRPRQPGDQPDPGDA